MEPAAWQFLAIAIICFAIAGLSLWHGTTLGIAWRGSLIARREREPKLFGCSVAIFIALGLFLIAVVASTRYRLRNGSPLQPIVAFRLGDGARPADKWESLTFGHSIACYNGSMSEYVSFAGFVAATICGGVFLDWALIGRLKMTLGASRSRDEVRYRDLPGWRLFLIIIASAAVGISRAPQDLLLLPFWAGVALFVFANICGVSFALRR